MQTMLFLLLPAMYAGSGRHLMTQNGKRSIIKVAQVQEFILHTLPLGALIFYNSSLDGV